MHSSLGRFHPEVESVAVSSDGNQWLLECQLSDNVCGKPGKNLLSVRDKYLLMPFDTSFQKCLVCSGV